MGGMHWQEVLQSLKKDSKRLFFFLCVKQFIHEINDYKSGDFFTFSGRLRCERLMSAPLRSRFCKVPSSRSRQRPRSARGRARSKANFFCRARTRSPVGAVPFPRHRKVHGQEKKKKKKKKKLKRAQLPPRLEISRVSGSKCQTEPGRLEKTRILLCYQTCTSEDFQERSLPLSPSLSVSILSNDPEWTSGKKCLPSSSCACLPVSETWVLSASLSLSLSLSLFLSLSALPASVCLCAHRAEPSLQRAWNHFYSLLGSFKSTACCCRVSVTLPCFNPRTKDNARSRRRHITHCFPSKWIIMGCCGCCFSEGPLTSLELCRRWWVIVFWVNTTGYKTNYD